MKSTILKNKEYEKQASTFDKERKDFNFADTEDESARPRKPTLMGAASKILLQENAPYQNEIRKDKNSIIKIPPVYYSTDRQSRLGEESDLLSRFQNVVMHKPYITNDLV